MPPIGDSNMDTPDLSWLMTQGGMGGPMGAPLAAGTAAAEGTSVQGVSGSTEKGMNIFKDTQSSAAEGVGGAEGHQALSSVPTLSPTVKVPETANDVPKDRVDEVQQIFRQLVSQLPPTLRTQLMKDMAKPMEERTPELAALESGLMTQAAETDWSRQINAGKPIPPGGKIGGVEGAQPGAVAGLTPEQEIGLKKGIIIPADVGTVNKVDPATMTPTDMAGTLRANSLNVIENQMRVVQTMANSIPAHDPAQPLLMEFLKFMGKILDEAKQFLREMTSSDANISLKNVLMQKSMQMDKLHKQIQSIEKQAAQRKKQQTTSMVMKILGPIIAIAMVALVILSGGSMIAVAIAVMCAMLAVISSMSDVVTKFFQAFINMVSEVFKAMGLPKDACDALTAVVMILLIIVVIIATKNVASIDVGGTVASQIGVQAATESTNLAATFVAMEVGMMLIQNTNCVQMLLKPILKALGVDDKTAEIIAMVVQLIVMLAMAIAGGVAIFKAAGAVAKSASGIVSKEMQSIAENLQDFATIAQIIEQAYSAVAHFRMADMAKFKAQLDKEITEIDTVMDVTKAFMKDLDQSTKSLTELATFYSDSFTQILTSMQKSVNDATSI